MDALMFLIHNTEKGTQKAMEKHRQQQEQYFKLYNNHTTAFLYYIAVHIKISPEVLSGIFLSKSEIQYVKLCVKLINEGYLITQMLTRIPARIIVD